MCGGGKAPEDNSHIVAQIEADAAREARAAEEARRQREEQRFNSSLEAAFNNALTDANQYFTQRGLDPNEYESLISQAASRAKGSVPFLDASPGTYFAGIGSQVFDNAEAADQGKFLRDISSFAPSGFETRRISNDVDDSFIDSILSERQGTAEQYIRNLLDRGVITNSGFSAAQNDLNNQAIGARSRLNEIGLGLLESGRAGASNIAADARSAATNYNLGEYFDPFEYQKQLNSHFEDFFGNIGNNIRAAAPTNLFDTSGLAGIAGAAQGAQNTNFDPGALAGYFADEEQNNTDNNTQTSNTPF